MPETAEQVAKPRTWRTTALWTAGILVLAGCTPASPEQLQSNRLHNLVANLGLKNAADPNSVVRELHSRPHQTVALLVRELEVVNPDFSDDKTWHVIWCIRALRSLTGQRFEHMTAEELSPRQKEFLRGDEPLLYFAEWMSRARVYVAPKDVQREVIQSWLKWTVQNGDTFAVKPFESYGWWYW